MEFRPTWLSTPQRDVLDPVITSGTGCEESAMCQPISHLPHAKMRQRGSRDVLGGVPIDNVRTIGTQRHGAMLECNQQHITNPSDHTILRTTRQRESCELQHAFPGIKKQPLRNTARE